MGADPVAVLHEDRRVRAHRLSQQGDVWNVTCLPRRSRDFGGGKCFQNPKVVTNDIGQEPVVTLRAVEYLGDGD